MLKILGLIVAVLAVAVLGLLAYAGTQPDSFRVARSIAVKAPPEKLFPHLADFHAWTAWSPYEKLDADLQRSYGGAPSGKGATYAWAGNKAGAGRMEIVEAAAPTRLLIQLDFSQPFTAHNMAEFTLQPTPEGTTLTWAMAGPNPLIAKAMHLFFSMDQLVGKDFETGLANLKAIAEK